MSTLVREQLAPSAVLEKEETHSLVLWNDDVNTFDWVIESLVEILGHSAEQAEQCALLVHTKGKYAVKRGSFEFLHPRADALSERGLTVSID
jgi:ATP-dependent Clp protease adaptor protein ClpS